MKDHQDDVTHKPEERKVESVQTETKDMSSQILDLAAVRGKVTQPGPLVGACEKLDPGFKKYYLVRHSWSVYGLDGKTLGTGMHNLKEQLPRHGWEINNYGKDSSKNRNLEILATNRKNQQTAHITWLRENDGEQALIYVMVTSPCYRAPEGTDLSRL